MWLLVFLLTGLRQLLCGEFDLRFGSLDRIRAAAFRYAVDELFAQANDRYQVWLHCCPGIRLRR